MNVVLAKLLKNKSFASTVLYGSESTLPGNSSDGFAATDTGKSPKAQNDA